MIFFRVYFSKTKKKQQQNSEEEQKNEINEKLKLKNNINIKEKVGNEAQEKEEDLNDKVAKEEENESREELNYNILFEKFSDYVQKNKMVRIDAIAEKLGKNKEETIKVLRELEKEGKIIGYVGDDGEYFFLTMKEFELLNNILLNHKKKGFNEEELEKLFQEIIVEGNENLF